jgi:hypothetical protein
MEPLNGFHAVYQRIRTVVPHLFPNRAPGRRGGREHILANASRIPVRLSAVLATLVASFTSPLQ